MSGKNDKPPDETNTTTAPATTATPAPATTTTAPATTTTPATTAAPAAKPASAPAAKPATQGGRTLGDVLQQQAAAPKPTAADKRDRRAARTALKAFGIDLPKGADIDAAAAEFRAKQESRKDSRKEYKAKSKRFDAAEANAKAFVDQQLAALPEADRAKARIFLGDGDAIAQLAKLGDLQKAGLLGTAPAAPSAKTDDKAATTTTTTTTETPPAKVAPATTSPTTTAPPAGGATPPPDAIAELGRLKTRIGDAVAQGRGTDPTVKRDYLAAYLAPHHNAKTLEQRTRSSG